MEQTPPSKKYPKSEILALCQECRGIHRKECIISDIEGSKEDYICVPKCAIFTPTNSSASLGGRNGRPTNEDNRPTNEADWKIDENNRTLTRENSTGHCLAEKQINEDQQQANHRPHKTRSSKCLAAQTGQPTTNTGQVVGMAGKFNEISLDQLDWEIIKLLLDHHYPSSISKTLGHSRTKIRRRLDRLEKADLIIPSDPGSNSKTKVKLYQVSSKLNPALIHNEDKPLVTPFTAHSMTFKFPILEGKQPRSSKGYKTASWTGYVFRYPDHTIRSTPKTIIIDINQDLGAASIDDLNLKYSQLAQSHAYKFADKYHIVLGGISKYREAHFTIEDNAMAQIISDRGEFRTTSGIQIDKSRSSGDLEMKEQTARAMEYTINKLPSIAAEMQCDIKDVTATTVTVDTKLSKIEDSLDSIHKWLFLERENRQLREDNQLLEKSLSNITHEVKEIRDMIQNPDTDTINNGGMYA